ncbi:MAG: hypothetical protein IJ711_11010, partial [Lachnospiraceae bacterium]|nr:hypothetical protein [Lachnospiraceae bacterium]
LVQGSFLASSSFVRINLADSSVFTAFGCVVTRSEFFSWSLASARHPLNFQGCITVYLSRYFCCFRVFIAYGNSDIISHAVFSVNTFAKSFYTFFTHTTVSFFRGGLL